MVKGRGQQGHGVRSLAAGVVYSADYIVGSTYSSRPPVVPLKLYDSEIVTLVVFVNCQRMSHGDTPLNTFIVAQNRLWYI